MPGYYEKLAPEDSQFFIEHACEAVISVPHVIESQLLCCLEMVVKADGLYPSFVTAISQLLSSTDPTHIGAGLRIAKQCCFVYRCVRDACFRLGLLPLKFLACIVIDVVCRRRQREERKPMVDFVSSSLEWYGQFLTMCTETLENALNAGR